MWNFANFHTLFDPEGWRNWDDRVQMVRTLREEGAEDRKLDWSLGLKASEIKWEKLLKNIQDSLLCLGDGVKTDERNGCQNEREGRKNGWTLGFSCGNLCFASVTEYRKMRGMGTKWDKGRNNGQLPMVFFVFDFAKENRFSFSPCWDGLLTWIPGGASSVAKTQPDQSAWIWYKFPH